MDDKHPDKPDSLDKPEPDPAWMVDDGALLEDEEDVADDTPLTTSDFHKIAQKQILNAVFAVLSETKMEWSVVAPFFEAAREVCIGDIEENAQIRLHSLTQEGDSWVEAPEAYLGISVSDREVGEEWLSDTRWLSEIAIAEEDPEQVRAIVGALERTIAKLNAWLADKPEGAPAADEPA